MLDDGASQRFATQAGLGISLNARWSVARELEAGSLVEILPNWRVVSDRALWLVYPKSNVLTAKVRVLIDFLVEKIGRTPPWRAGAPARPDAARYAMSMTTLPVASPPLSRS